MDTEINPDWAADEDAIKDAGHRDMLSKSMLSQIIRISRIWIPIKPTTQDVD